MGLVSARSNAILYADGRVYSLAGIYFSLSTEYFGQRESWRETDRQTNIGGGGGGGSGERERESWSRQRQRERERDGEGGGSGERERTRARDRENKTQRENKSER